MEDLVFMALEKEIPETKGKIYTPTLPQKKKRREKKEGKNWTILYFYSVAMTKYPEESRKWQWLWREWIVSACTASFQSRQGLQTAILITSPGELICLMLSSASGSLLRNGGIGSVTYTETILLRHAQLMYTTLHWDSLPRRIYIVSVTINVDLHRLIPIGINLYTNLNTSINSAKLYLQHIKQRKVAILSNTVTYKWSGKKQ